MVWWNMPHKDRGPPAQQGVYRQLFETGCRVSETLALETNNFEVREGEGVILVRKMPFLKRYKKSEEWVD